MSDIIFKIHLAIPRACGQVKATRHRSPDELNEQNVAKKNEPTEPDNTLNALRAGLRRISPRNQPAEWAAGQVKLGATLRQRARRELGSRRAQTLLQVIASFEGALGVYCRCEPAPANFDSERSLGLADGGNGEPSADAGAVDLILEVTCRPFMTDSDELHDAIRLLQASCSREARDADFAEWSLSMINLGCALTLAGKCDGTAGDVARIEEAIDTFNALLSEPRMRGMTYEQAIALINLADALCSMSELEIADRRVECLESAAFSLAKALCLVVPAELSAVVGLDSGGLA